MQLVAFDSILLQCILHQQLLISMAFLHFDVALPLQCDIPVFTFHWKEIFRNDRFFPFSTSKPTKKALMKYFWWGFYRRYECRKLLMNWVEFHTGLTDLSTFYTFSTVGENCGQSSMQPDIKSDTRKLFVRVLTFKNRHPKFAVGQKYVAITSWQWSFKNILSLAYSNEKKYINIQMKWAATKNREYDYDERIDALADSKLEQHWQIVVWRPLTLKIIQSTILMFDNCGE